MSKLERTGEIPSSELLYTVEKIPSWRNKEGVVFSPLVGLIILLVLVVLVFALGIYFIKEYAKALEEQRRYYQEIF